MLHDPVAKKKDVEKLFDLTLQPLKNMKKLDVLVILLDHKQYKTLSRNKLVKLLKPSGCIIDLKGILQD